MLHFTAGMLLASKRSPGWFAMTMRAPETAGSHVAHLFGQTQRSVRSTGHARVLEPSPWLLHLAPADEPAVLLHRGRAWRARRDLARPRLRRDHRAAVADHLLPRCNVRDHHARRHLVRLD